MNEGRRLTRAEMRERGLLRALPRDEVAPVDELRQTRDIPVVRTQSRALEPISGPQATDYEAQETVASLPVFQDSPAKPAEEPAQEIPQPSERVSVFDRFNASTTVIDDDPHPAVQRDAGHDILPPAEAENTPETTSLRERLLARTQGEVTAAGSDKEEAEEPDFSHHQLDEETVVSEEQEIQPPVTVDSVEEIYEEDDEEKDGQRRWGWPLFMFFLIILAIGAGLLLGYAIIRFRSSGVVDPSHAVASAQVFINHIKEIM